MCMYACIYIPKEPRLVQGIKVHAHRKSAYSKIWRGIIRQSRLVWPQC